MASTTAGVAAPSRRDPVRREAILHAAAARFADAGFAATAMDDVAGAAGVSKLVVYRHFATKEGVYRAVLERVFERQAELFLTNLANGLEAAGSVRALLDVAREWPEGFRLLWRHAVREPQFGEYARHLRELAVGAARGVVEPLVDEAFAEWAAQTLFDNLIDAVLNWLDHGRRADDDEFVTVEAATLQASVGAWAAHEPRRETPGR
jgi:AcrR family transcriptional regulator